MNIPNWLAAVARTVLVAAIAVVLLFSSLYLFATRGFVRHEYAQAGFPPSRRFGARERLRLSDTILAYVRGRESLHNLASLRTDSGEVALEPEEVQHLTDVRGVICGILAAHGLSVALALGCAALLWRSGRGRYLTAYVRQGVWLAAGVIAFVGVAAALDFGAFFTRFHQLFFPPETWTFLERDTLIQLYPLRFWMDTVWRMAVVTGIELALAYVLSLVLERCGRIPHPER